MSGTCKTDSQIKFKNFMAKSSLHDYSQAYTHLKGTITVRNTKAAGSAVYNVSKKVIFKNCVPFPDCINEINNEQKDPALIYAIADTKLYVLVVTLSTQDNANMLLQLKSVFKRTINWDKCQSELTIQRQNKYLDFSIDCSVYKVNRLFVLRFENNKQATSDIFF